LEEALENNKITSETRPPVCDYEGSDYQTRFWEKGGRAYEDRCEAIAIQRLLPKSGSLLLELGAGAGRNTLRYSGFDRIVLLDYSRTQLKQAQEALGKSDRYIYVAADIYRLPFIDGLFDAATMIRVLHHMADAPAALRQVRDALQPGAEFVLEFANKRNIKSIIRYAFHRQTWNPFSPEPIEYAPLNFDFHPLTLKNWLNDLGLVIEKKLSVSYFRIGFLKKTFSPGFLAAVDSIFQWTAALGLYSPSVFMRIRRGGDLVDAPQHREINSYFKCPECSSSPLFFTDQKISCISCHRVWNITDGIFDFRGD
jgi:SAM-dependent methyltransferase